MVSRTAVRILFLAAVLLLGTVLVGTNVVGGAGSDGDEYPASYGAIQRQADLPMAEREPVVPPRNGTTVVSSHLNAEGELFAFAPNGTLLYYDDANDGYWDVDPSPHGDRTVTYTAADRIGGGSLNCRSPVCIRVKIEEANLTTGETSVLFSRVYSGYRDHEWHDADWVNDTHLAVAGIYEDRIFVVNATSGLIEWQWEAQSHYDLSEGGAYPQDWTHLNDVEPLERGRIMASFRRMDEVVFVDREGGLQEDWTLEGAGNLTLQGQHNPDYIPAEAGGPAVLVADSDGDRILEFQRSGDASWERSWAWQDTRLQWPRDADRLPNGNTLVADTHGNRVIEVNETGAVVWRVGIGTAYEAERLETGDESTGGPAAAAADLDGRGVDAEQTANGSQSGDGPASRLLFEARNALPPLLVNGWAVVAPKWLSLLDLFMLVSLLGLATLWAVVEFRWSDYYLRSPLDRRE